MTARRVVVFGLACALVLALSACSGSKATTDSSTSSTTGSAPKTPASNITTKSGEGPLPQTDKVKVPDEVGFGMTTARMNLAESHLTWKIVTEPANADMPRDNSVVVIKQTPAAGTLVDSGSEVTLVIKKK